LSMIFSKNRFPLFWDHASWFDGRNHLSDMIVVKRG
jgi:hypothetical protein